MPDQSFRTMLANLEQQGELIRFTAEVDPLTDMAASDGHTRVGSGGVFSAVCLPLTGLSWAVHRALKEMENPLHFLQ